MCYVCDSYLKSCGFKMVNRQKHYVVRIDEPDYSIISKASEATGKKKQRIVKEIIQSSKLFNKWAKYFNESADIK